MRRGILIAATLLSACGAAREEPANAVDTSIVSISLPDEPPPPWTGDGAMLIQNNCLACHSSEMIAHQPPLTAEKWQATIDKMRTVYKAQIAKSDDARLVAALVATQPGSGR